MCYFLYITQYNTPDNIKPFGYCIHHGPKIFGGAGPLPLLIRNTIKQKVLIMMFQIRMCFLVCTNIPRAGCICLNIMTEQLGFSSYWGQILSFASISLSNQAPPKCLSNWFQ